MKARYYLTASLLVAFAAAAFAWKLPDLPASVPIHWNIHGQADAFGSPWQLFVAGPVLMAGLVALFAALPWLSPRRFEVDSFERTYLSLMLIVVALLGYAFLLALGSASGAPIDMARALAGGLALMAILVGNLLGKVRRNFFIGIRTPWTLANERVWYETHRLGAWVLVVAGLLALAAVVAGAPAWTSVALVVLGVLVPAAYSLVLYKRLEA